MFDFAFPFHKVVDPLDTRSSSYGLNSDFLSLTGEQILLKLNQIIKSF